MAVAKASSTEALARPLAPLTLQVELTAAQRQLLATQFGLDLGAVPFRSAARWVRCTIGGVAIRVDRGVFVPTPSAERVLRILVDATASFTKPVVVDVGTGSGALALAFAETNSSARVFGTDLSELALRCARRNRARLRLQNARFLRGSLLEPLPARLRGRVTAIAANVPYLPPAASAAADTLFPDRTAVGPGTDGLDLVRALARSARYFLMPGGRLLIQLGAPQWNAFQRELAALGYHARLAAGSEGAAGSVVVEAEWRNPREPTSPDRFGRMHSTESMDDPDK